MEFQVSWINIFVPLVLALHLSPLGLGEAEAGTESGLDAIAFLSEPFSIYKLADLFSF